MAWKKWAINKQRQGFEGNGEGNMGRKDFIERRK